MTLDVWPFVLLALAAYRTTVLVVKDWVPFAGLREWVWRRFPYEATDDRGVTHLGYLLTCQSCAGVWNCAAWWGAWKLAPGVTLTVAVPFALAAAQRTLAVYADSAEEHTVKVEAADEEG